MKSFNSIIGRASIVLAAGGLLCLPAPSPAAPITLYVDSGLSSMTLQGGVAGLTFVPVSAGSMNDFWGGTITGDLTAGIFTFSGGSAITALSNGGAPFIPGIQPGITGGVDNYGAIASGSVLALGGFTTADGAWRNLTLDILTGTAQDTLAPSGMTVKYLAGSKLEYFITSPGLTGPGVSDLSAVAAANNTTPGTVSWDGTTLTLPVRFTMTGANGLVQLWQGNIVSVVPEPSSLALALVGLGLFAARRARISPTQKS